MLELSVSRVASLCCNTLDTLLEDDSRRVYQTPRVLLLPSPGFFDATHSSNGHLEDSTLSRVRGSRRGGGWRGSHYRGGQRGGGRGRRWHGWGCHSFYPSTVECYLLLLL